MFKELTEEEDDDSEEPEKMEKTQVYDPKMGSALGTARLCELPTAADHRAMPGSKGRTQIPATTGYAQIGVHVQRHGGLGGRAALPGSSGGERGAGGGGGQPQGPPSGGSAEEPGAGPMSRARDPFTSDQLYDEKLRKQSHKNVKPNQNLQIGGRRGGGRDSGTAGEGGNARGFSGRAEASLASRKTKAGSTGPLRYKGGPVGGGTVGPSESESLGKTTSEGDRDNGGNGGYGPKPRSVDADEDGSGGMFWQSVDELEETKRKRKAEGRKEELRPLKVIEPEGVNVIDETGEWEEIEFAVDSGATETVIGEEDLPGIEIKAGLASKRGTQYEVANGVLIPNLGEKKFGAYTEEGGLRNITAQVCEVNKPLLSVRKVMTGGNRVVFDDEGSYIENKATGEVTWLKEQGGMFFLKMYVKKAPF